MSRAGRAYLVTVILCGLAAVAASLYDLHQHPLGYQWYMLAALTLVSGSATVTLPSVGATISVSETFVFASVLLFGPAAGTIMVALDGLVISFWMAKRLPEWYRALFNMAAPAISIWLAAQLLFSIAGIQPLFQQQSSVNTLLLPLLVFAIVYFGLNSWLIALAVSFEKGSSTYRIWRENFLWLSLNYFSGASVALLLVVYTRDVDLRFIGVIVPLLLVLYFTFKTTMGRVEDANNHLQQLNRLYLSTIETLAMAIDAKDQITHGHIRRVQRYAVGLAKSVGVSDETLIKAIEAAALLHDMGKLAVPEYILNKPGKLTPAEFDKMKAHATVGADILGAVDFPYPVVPIVRHHHENWDGTGYPTGIRGTDIPIGARILSVVDCFDALTSDRPYRPRLSDEDALEILIQRRGTMYDPLIVDTFVRVHKDISPEPLGTAQQRHALNEIKNSSQTSSQELESSQLDEIAAGAEEMLTVYELAQALGGQSTSAARVGAVCRHLRRLIPFAVFVFYSFDDKQDDLEASHVIGGTPSNIQGLRIPTGQRLSGWVAANRQTILNSDPVLDLGELARAASPRLKSCLSTALVSSGELVGVLTLYSTVQDGFTDDHRRILETVAKQVAHALRTRSESESPRQEQSGPGLTSRQLELQTRPIASAVHLMHVDIVGLGSVNASHGNSTGEEVSKHVAVLARRVLRADDILLQVEVGQFIALLHGAEAVEAARIASDIRELVQRTPFLLGGGHTLTVNVTVTLPPTQLTDSLGELVSSLKRHASHTPHTPHHTTIH